jgi:hypothetical protein
MDLSTFICPVCKEYETSDLDSIRIHSQKKHKLSSIELYSHLFLNGTEVKCACGCGETPKFWSLQRGFAKFVRGHSARVNNNWGHNEAAREKSLKKRRDQGLWSRDPWNRGKTKESDERLLRSSETMIKLHGERYSCLMKENRLSGAIPSLTGSSHPKWRGGTSALGPLCRSKIYRTWAFPKLQAAGFKCSRCDTTRDLEVHHDGERFAEIMHKGIETLGEPGDDWDRKECFAEWVSWYHTENDVSGKVLCSLCHDATHGEVQEIIVLK